VTAERAAGEQAGLDRLLLDPTRLSVMAVLCETEWCDFSFVRTAVGLSDSALSKQIATLRSAGHVEQERTYQGRVPRTTLRATDQGRRHLIDHIAALHRIAERAQR
jgi:DNA-binding transcriptional ArsR family regulator